MGDQTPRTMGRAFLILAGLAAAAAASKPHIVVIVADDLGRNDLGVRNAHADGPRTITPTLDGLIG